MSILFALIATFGHAFDSFFARRGLVETPAPMAAAFITLTINFLFFAILSFLFLPRHLLRLDLVYVFIIAGLMAPGFARVCSYKGLETLGMSIASPITNSDCLFTVTLAVIFLGEPLTLPLAVGIAGVVTGVILLSYETGKGKKGSITREFKRRYLFYPFGAALLYASSVFLRKVGLGMTGSPLLGATFTSGTSWFVVALVMMGSGQMKGVFHIRRGLVYFLIAGIVGCITWLALFQALHLGRVSVVTPIAGSYCLVTLLLSMIFLRGVERITGKIIASTLMIVGGVIIISLAR